MQIEHQRSIFLPCSLPSCILISAQQKLKFNFPIGEPWTQPFVTLLNGENEEIILREKEQLHLIALAVEEAKKLGADGEELAKLTQLNAALFSKINLPGTKAQLKPVYSKRQAGHPRRLTKLTLVFKWGGEVQYYIKSLSRHTPDWSLVYAFCKVSITRCWRKFEEGYFYHEYVTSPGSKSAYSFLVTRQRSASKCQGMCGVPRCWIV